MEPAVRAMEPAGRALEPAGRPGASWKGQLRSPGGDGGKKRKRTERSWYMVDHHPLQGHCSKTINYPVLCVFFCVMEGLTDRLAD